MTVYTFILALILFYFPEWEFFVAKCSVEKRFDKSTARLIPARKQLAQKQTIALGTQTQRWDVNVQSALRLFIT